MDANKLEKLREINYKLRRCCGNCEFANFISEWSTCRNHRYQHQKHSVAMRDLSVNHFGYCPGHKWKGEAPETWEEFREA